MDTPRIVTPAEPDPQPAALADPPPALGRVVVCGVGNIGSRVADVLARSPQVTDLVLIDRDRYEADNLPHQAITPAMVGRPKPYAMADHLRRVAPQKRYEPWHEPVEHVPLLTLRAAVVVVALDNRAGRIAAHRHARRLGVPSIDAAVDGRTGLIAVTVFGPGDHDGCYECPFTAADYDDPHQRHACGGTPAAPTRASAELGMHAAAMTLTQAQRLLAGDRGGCGHQVLFDARHHRLQPSRVRRTASCRFDHQRWDLVPTVLGRQTSLIRLFQRVPQEDTRVEVPLRPFATVIRCGCGKRRRTLQLHDRLARRGARRCGTCGEAMHVLPVDLEDALRVAALTPGEQCRPLAKLGLRVGDVLALHEPRQPIRRLALLGGSPAAAAYRRAV